MRCQPGDFAIVINSRFESNIGAIVKVKDIAFIHGDFGPFWTFEKACRPLLLGGFGSDATQFITARESTAENNAFIRDADLQRLMIYND
jgi:hypothetical protein